MRRSVAISICAAAIGTAGHTSYGAEGNITIGAASPSGVYYAVGDAICRAVTTGAQKRSIGCGVVASSGSVSNVIELDPVKMQFAIVQSDVHFNAFEGRGLFAGAGANRNLRSVLSLHAEALTVVVRADSTSKLVGDIRGKRLNLGPIGTGTRETAEDLLSVFSWSDNDRANFTYLDVDDATAALCKGGVDAVAFMVGHPSATIMELSTKCPIRILSMAPAAIQKAVQNAPYYTGQTIPAGLYPGHSAPATTLGVTATLLTSANIADDIAHAIVESVFGNLGEFKKSAPALSHLDPANMIRSGLTAPLHPGAIKYYKSQGMISSKEVADNETKIRAAASSVQHGYAAPETSAPTIVVPDFKQRPGIDIGTEIDSPTLSTPPTQKVQPWERDDSRF